MYEYAGTIVRVIDGDTVDVTLDLGLDIHVNQRLRLVGVNAPEKNTPEGMAAKAWMEQYLLPGDTVVVKTVKDHKEKYGRYLASVRAAPHAWKGTLDIDIATELVKAGHAVPYDGGKR